MEIVAPGGWEERGGTWDMGRGTWEAGGAGVDGGDGADDEILPEWRVVGTASLRSESFMGGLRLAPKRMKGGCETTLDAVGRHAGRPLRSNPALREGGFL